MKIKYYNLDTIINYSIDLIYNAINKSLEEKNICNLLLTGGESIGIIYENLIKLNINWKNVKIFISDERFVNINSIYRNERFIKNYFNDKIEFPNENLYGFNFKYGIKKSTILYDSLLDNLTKFDVSILSIGEDGHIASIFPKNYSKQKNSLFLFNAPKFPQIRTSLSLHQLLNSDLRFLFCIGKEKSKKVSYLLNHKNLPYNLYQPHYFFIEKFQSE
jgi:6-phosphogluconolactonase